MTVEYHPAIEREIKAIRDFYESRAPGLGGEFVEEFERQVLRIAAAPKRWMVVTGDLRRALMPRFPYVIYFRQAAPDRVRITVVKHQRRHPAYGRDRATLALTQLAPRRRCLRRRVLKFHVRQGTVSP